MKRIKFNKIWWKNSYLLGISCGYIQPFLDKLEPKNNILLLFFAIICAFYTLFMCMLVFLIESPIRYTIALISFQCTIKDVINHYILSWKSLWMGIKGK